MTRRAADDVVREPAREGVPRASCERDSVVLVLVVDGLRKLGSGVADDVGAFGAGETSTSSAGADEGGRALSDKDSAIDASAEVDASAGAVSVEGMAASSRNPALGSRTVCDEAGFAAGSSLGDSILEESASLTDTTSQKNDQ